MEVHVDDGVASVTSLHAVDVVEHQSNSGWPLPSLLFELEVKFGVQSVDGGVVAASDQNAVIRHTLYAGLNIRVNQSVLEAKVQLIDQTVIV